MVNTGLSWKARSDIGRWKLSILTFLGSNVTHGMYNILSENIENYEDFIVTDLKVTNTFTGEERQVCHFQFTSWPDYGTPDSALSMLQFLQVRS